MKTTIAFIGNNKLRGVKPSNELNHFTIDGKPVWFHLAQLFDKQSNIYFFLEKKIKGQPTLPNVFLEEKQNLKSIMDAILKKEDPDRLIVIDDSLVFSKQTADELVKIEENAVVFNLDCLVDKLSISGIINDEVVQNLAYGIGKQESNIFKSTNIYVLNKPILTEFFYLYTDPSFWNYVIFEIINELITQHHTIKAVLNKQHKFVGVKNVNDLQEAKKIIYENSRNIIKQS